MCKSERKTAWVRRGGKSADHTLYVIQPPQFPKDYLFDRYAVPLFHANKMMKSRE